MRDVYGGDNANYTVRPVFARCLILVARVVLREHYNRFLAALVLQLSRRAFSRPGCEESSKWGFLWNLSYNLSLS